MNKAKIRKWLLDAFRFASRDFSGEGKFLNLLLLALNERSRSSFYTFHHRPKQSAGLHLDGQSRLPYKAPSVAIVIQGPIQRRDNFTIESAYIYRRLMPEAHIIISTWASERDSKLDALAEEGIRVVYSTPPERSGANNINFQIVSTQSGIAAAAELGCQYVLKSRSDQRFYAPNLLPYFLSLLQEYPPTHPKRQRQRIIELSMNICRFRPYSMCDMFQFGHIDDLHRMWNLELDPRSISVADYSSQSLTPRQISEDRIAEIYVHRAYLESLGDEAAVDLATYYRILSEYFIIIDKEVVDLFWNKYHAREYQLAENPMYGAERVKARFFHRDWMAVRYFGPQALDLDPSLMDKPEV